MYNKFVSEKDIANFMLFRAFPNMKKKNYSQYDLVKIKVHIQEHFYVFSRFLMSRILTLIWVNEKDAIKITLDIKKHFVESHLTDIT